MLPKGWRAVPLSTLVGSLDSGVSVNGEDRQTNAGEVGVLKISAVTYGVFNPDEHKAVVMDEIERVSTSPRAGRILISRSNTANLVGASAYVHEDYPSLFLPDKLWQLEPKNKKDIDTRWLAHWLGSEKTRSAISKLATGTSGSMKNISKASLLALPIQLPPTEEQKQIAGVLNVWDSAIATTERLLANSRNTKLVLAQSLLSGRKRLIGSSPWRKKPISKLIVESRAIGSGGDEARKLTIKLYGRGVCEKSDKRPGSESTQYYRRSAGQFIYSKLDFLNGAFGLIPPELDGFESTLDLPAFDLLPGVDARWFFHFISREEFYRSQHGLANGGRKARRVNPKDLLHVLVPVPRIEEQRAIANAIDIASQVVRADELQLRNLRAEKSALMQQLLTGKRRVRLPAQAKAKRK